MTQELTTQDSQLKTYNSRLTEYRGRSPGWQDISVGRLCPRRQLCGFARRRLTQSMRCSSFLGADGGAVLLELEGLDWSRTHDLHDDFFVPRLVIVVTECRLEDETALFHRGHLVKIG